MVFQSYALYPHMTVAKNLSFGLENLRMPQAEIDRRVKDAADMLQIGALLQRKPRELSGGQRQRVAIGRAIVRDPQVFLFDEPLSNLDAALRVQTRGEISRLHKRLKATMVYVTHDQIEAMTMADRIAVMNGGRVEQFGAPLELFDRPANQFVAGFIGSPRMNFYTGRIVSGGPEGVTIDVSGFGLCRFAVDGSKVVAGDAVTLGIRPNHFEQAAGARIGRSGRPSSPSIIRNAWARRPMSTAASSATTPRRSCTCRTTSRSATARNYRSPSPPRAATCSMAKAVCVSARWQPDRRERRVVSKGRFIPREGREVNALGQGRRGP